MKKGWSTPLLMLMLVLSGCGTAQLSPVAPSEPPTASEVRPVRGHAAVGDSGPATPEPKPNVSPDTADAGITLEEARQVPVLPPSHLAVHISDLCVTVVWEGTGASLSHYEVMRKAVGSSTWVRVGSVPARTSNVGPYQWQGEQPPSALSYTFGVAAVDTRGVRSEVSLPDPH